MKGDHLEVRTMNLQTRLLAEFIGQALINPIDTLHNYLIRDMGKSETMIANSLRANSVVFLVVVVVAVIQIITEERKIIFVMNLMKKGLQYIIFPKSVLRFVFFCFVLFCFFAIIKHIGHTWP